jgi:hypothetical protein
VCFVSLPPHPPAPHPHTHTYTHSKGRATKTEILELTTNGGVFEYGGWGLTRRTSAMAGAGVVAEAAGAVLGEKILTDEELGMQIFRQEERWR